MKFSDILSFAVTNIRAQRLRTFLTTMTISVGAFLIFLLPSLGLGVANQIQKQFESQDALTSISISPKIEYPQYDSKTGKFSDEKLDKAITLTDLAAIRATSDVSAVEGGDVMIQSNKITFDSLGKTIKSSDALSASIGAISLTGSQADKLSISLMPVSREASLSDANLSLVAGSNFSNNDPAFPMLITQKTLDGLGVTDPSSIIGKTVTMVFLRSNDSDADIPIESKTYQGTIIGVVKVKDTNKLSSISDSTTALMLPLENAWAPYTWQLGDANQNQATFNEISIKVTSADKVSAVADTLKAQGYSVTTAQDSIRSFQTGVRILTLILSSFGIVALFVGALSIVNMMMMAVTERTKEIGILRSQGASRRTIQGLFLAESAALAVGGGIIGIIFGMLVSLGINAYFMSQLTKFSAGGPTPNITSFFDYSPGLIFSVLGFIALDGLIAGIAPAIRASRLNVVESLRYE